MTDNPFAEGENRVIRPPATAIVIFGATGDLTHRKLMPALYNLLQDGYLPSNFAVFGAARSDLTDEQFRQSMYESVKKHSRRTIDESVWKQFAANLYYQPLDPKSDVGFRRLKERLENLSAGGRETFNYLYYLAVAPSVFGPTSARLKEVGLVEPPKGGVRETRLVVEKPFGHDLPSALELNSTLTNSFAEEQIFRIDHYLGKETVQNILVFRFANGIFENVWNRNYIDHIQLSWSEDIGVGSRAGYFDQSGLLRDIVQNHLLQVLALLCIEPPTSLSDANSIRNEKVKVLSSFRRFSYDDVATHTVRAQYTPGTIDGNTVNGYLEEQDIAPGSKTETFTALRMEIDNWRWAGVPIFVRAGKRLPKRITEISIFFKKPPESMFRGRQIGELEPNVLAIQVQPNEGISLKISSKPPGPRMRVRPVVMDFTYGNSFGVASADAYERLLLDAMKGDATLFIRNDEIEQAWDLLDPVLNRWREDPGVPISTYEAGTWGPSAAAQLLRPTGHRWRRL